MVFWQRVGAPLFMTPEKLIVVELTSQFKISKLCDHEITLVFEVEVVSRNVSTS